MFEQNFLCFSVYWLPPVLPFGTTEKNLAPSFLLFTHSYLHTLIKSLPSLLLSRLTVPGLSALLTGAAIL